MVAAIIRSRSAPGHPYTVGVAERGWETAPAGRRFHWGHALLVTGAVLVVTTLVWAAALIWLSGEDSSAAPEQLAGGASAAPPTATPSASPSPTASPTPSDPTAPPTADSALAEPAQAGDAPPTVPTRAPSAPIEQEEAPPPPAAEPPPPDVDCPYYEGENAPEAEVAAALDAAAAQRFWTVSQVSLPPRLIKAVAEQESGWQSAIIACDGGIGTMQVMPNTADWMNQRFDTSYEVATLTGNTMLGSAFLQWLTKYFGDVYFGGDYAIRDADCQQVPDVPDHREWCLLNAVISAYNYGHGAVDDEAGDGDETYYPNHRYVENVRALQSRF